jgi:hypothetical protein
VALSVVAAAHLIAHLSPARIRALLSLVRRGAASAAASQAKAARVAVLSVSLSCAGEGCVPRAVATVPPPRHLADLAYGRPPVSVRGARLGRSRWPSR